MNSNSNSKIKIYMFTPLPEVLAQLNEAEERRERRNEIIDIIFSSVVYAAMVAGAFVLPMFILAVM